jgi:hypothetical protein
LVVLVVWFFIWGTANAGFLPLVAIAAGLTIRDARLVIRPVVVAVYVLCCVLTMRLYHQKNHGYLNSFPIEDYWHAVTGIASKVG